MNMKTTLMIVLCSAAIFLSGCATSHTHATAWEYKVVSGQFDGPLQAEINKAADDGWVLVSSSSKTPDYGFAVMKRKKQ
jgi:hypothetical protein